MSGAGSPVAVLGAGSWGTALGIQAGIGNLGVSVVQFLTPWVITAPLLGAIAGGSLSWTKGAAVKQLWIQNATFIWIVPVVFFTLAAAVGLRSIPVRGSFRDQAVIFRRKHNWVMTSLYMMTFGSFSGFAAAFALGGAFLAAARMSRSSSL